jgi:predicted nucleic acid-binding protein
MSKIQPLKAGDRLICRFFLFLKRSNENPNITLISQTSQQFQPGLELYKNRLDKNWSLTDCVSFKIMEQMGIYEALAYDKHFEQAGFKALLRD